MNKSKLSKQVREFEKDMILSRWKIDMEKRNILKSFQAIKRTSGNSDLGLPPSDRTDNIYVQSAHSKSGLRLSEKRLMEWKRREKELQRFMREMTIGFNDVINKHGSRPSKRHPRPKSRGHENDPNSAKVFRLYLENDAIQSKLEPRFKDTKRVQLDSRNFIEVPCNAYIEEDEGQRSYSSEINQYMHQRPKSGRNRVSFSKLPDGYSCRSPRESLQTDTMDTRTSPPTSARRKNSARRHERNNRRPSSRGDNSLGLIDDILGYESNEMSSPELIFIRRGSHTSDSVRNFDESDGSRTDRGSVVKSPRSTSKRLTPRLLTPARHNCIKTPSQETPRTILVKKSKKYVHTNHLYDPYVLETSDDGDDDQSNSEDSVFTQESLLDNDSGDENTQDNFGECPVEETSKFVQILRGEEEEAKKDLPGNDSWVKTDAPNSGQSDVQILRKVIKQVRFSDRHIQRSQSCPNNMGVGVGGSVLSTNTTSPKKAMQSISTQTQTTRSESDSSSTETGKATRTTFKNDLKPSTDDSKQDLRSETSSRIPLQKQPENESPTKVYEGTLRLKQPRKSQSDIFVDHPPKINSIRNLSVGSVFNVAIAVSKITRRKSLNTLVEQNNPDLREAVRQERLRDLEVKSKQLSKEANNFNLFKSCFPRL